MCFKNIKPYSDRKSVFVMCKLQKEVVLIGSSSVSGCLTPPVTIQFCCCNLGVLYLFAILWLKFYIFEFYTVTHTC